MIPKILIADDDPFFVETLQERLEWAGFEVDSVMEGIRAVEWAHKKKPDLILLDLSMPAGSGLTVLESLRSRPETRKIPVIVVSGLEGDRLEEQVARAGAQGFFRKPYDFRRLLEKIQELIGKVF